MRQGFFVWHLTMLLVACVGGCSDEGIGQSCTPDKVPCDMDGKNCGFRADEQYVETSADACPSRMCIVFRLDNGSAGIIPADPRVVCTGTNDAPGCVSPTALDEASYCSCRCNRADNKNEGTCTCPNGFVCEPFFGSDSFCVKHSALE
jgi:hypothetical protein